MKSKIFSLVVATITLGFIACNNDGDSTSVTDSTTTDVTTNNSTSSYAAQSDSFRINSEAGNYLDARTGKPIKINVDASTCARVNAETNEPVDYYVDKRTWWVYGNNSWDTIGSAQMQGNELRYRDDNDKWVSFDEKWKVDEGDGEAKMKAGDTKAKVESDGDGQVKTEDDKVKTDEEGIKVK
jgi:uncharacterized lipoprotein NlpE involved in copper resistance